MELDGRDSTSADEGNVRAAQLILGIALIVAGILSFI